MKKIIFVIFFLFSLLITKSLVFAGQKLIYLPNFNNLQESIVWQTPSNCINIQFITLNNYIKNPNNQPVYIKKIIFGNPTNKPPYDDWVFPPDYPSGVYQVEIGYFSGNNWVVENSYNYQINFIGTTTEHFVGYVYPFNYQYDRYYTYRWYELLFDNYLPSNRYLRIVPWKSYTYIDCRSGYLSYYTGTTTPEINSKNLQFFVNSDFFFATTTGLLAKIYEQAPDNPIITNVSPNNVNYGNNNLTEIFTSSSPLTFNVENLSKGWYFSILYNDAKNQTWIPLINTNIVFDSSNDYWQVKFYFDNQKRGVIDFYYNNNKIFGFITEAVSQKFAYGKTIFKIILENANGLTGEGIFSLNFGEDSTITNEDVNFFIETFSTTTREIFNFENKDNQVFSATGTFPNIRLNFSIFSLTEGNNYSFRYYIVNENNNQLEFFYNFNLPLNIKNITHQSKLIELDGNATYKIVYELYKNANLILERINYIDFTGRYSTKKQKFLDFYQNVITSFGFPSSTTPTPTIYNIGQFLGQIFNLPFLENNFSVNLTEQGKILGEKVTLFIAHLKNLPFFSLSLITLILFFFVFFLSYNILKRFLLR